MNPKDQPIGNDPTIMGNEKPRSNRDDDDLTPGEEIQEEDPRNGMNRPPVDGTSRPGRSAERDEV